MWRWGLDCGSVCRLGRGVLLVGERGNVSCGFSFFFLSLWGVILLSGVWFVFARSLVVDWFCLFFFFGVTLVSLFLIACLVCEVCLFLQV